MRFDYRFGTEATFDDWVNDGIKKAEFIISCLEPQNKENSQSEKIVEILTNSTNKQ